MIAVTGANGLVGSVITGCLQTNGFDVVGVVRQAPKPGYRTAVLDDPHSLHQAFAGADTIVHAAGLVSFNPRHRNELYRVNVEGTANVVNAALRGGVTNLIHISSVAAFPRPTAGNVVTELAKAADSKSNYSSYYGFTKNLAELEVFRGGEEGLQVAIVNPSVVLAPSQHMRSSARTFEYVLNEKPFYTNAMLNYVDARDVAQAVVAMLRALPHGERFILHAGSVPYIDFFRLVAMQLGKRPPFIRVGHTLISLVAGLEEVRAFVLQQEPVITRAMANSLRKKVVYDSAKSVAQLGLQYRKLEDTVNWCCGFYREHVTTKY